MQKTAQIAVYGANALLVALLILSDLFRQQKLHDLVLIIYSADYSARNSLSIVDSAFRSMEWRISGLVYHPPLLTQSVDYISNSI